MVHAIHKVLLVDPRKLSIQGGSKKHTCMRVPADDVAAMTKPATARPAMTPPCVVPVHTANTKMMTCRGNTHFMHAMEGIWSMIARLALQSVSMHN